MRNIVRIFVTFVAVMAMAIPAVAKPTDNPNHPDRWERWAANNLGLDLECEKSEGGFDGLTYWIADDFYPLVLTKGGPNWPRKFFDVEPGDQLDANWNFDKLRHYGLSYVITCSLADGGVS
jgi:hypothetical protein